MPFHTHTHSLTHSHKHAIPHTHTLHQHTHIHARAHAHTQNMPLNTNTHSHTHTHTHTHTHACMCVLLWIKFYLKHTHTPSIWNRILGPKTMYCGCGTYLEEPPVLYYSRTLPPEVSIPQSLQIRVLMLAGSKQQQQLALVFSQAIPI